MIINPSILTALAVFSVITFVGSLIVIPIIISRLPNDYFLLNGQHSLMNRGRKVGSFFLNKLLKNLLGVIFILAGIAMLILPGQGILTILIGLGITSFPGKEKLEQKLIKNKKVFNSLNWIRKRGKVDPFLYPK